MWFYYDNIDQNIGAMFPPPRWLYVMKKAEGLQTQYEEEMLNKVSTECIWRVQM